MKTKTHCITQFIFFAITSLSALHAAELVIIVHPSATLSQMSEDDAKRLFLGKTRNFPDGSTALPVDQTEGTQDRAQFYHQFIGKTESQLKSYWATLIFSGKGTPPKAVGDAGDVKAIVAKNPSAIGYIDKRFADNNVKIIPLSR